MHQTKAGNNFILDTESEFRVPAAGGGGVLTAELPGLGIKKQASCPRSPLGCAACIPHQRCTGAQPGAGSS
jgi:hypothetical protein